MRRRPYQGPYRTHPQPELDFSGALKVDLFAGGGGASTGMEWALGKSPDIAVNHDRRAVAMHRVNHPHTHHFCESVHDVHPLKVCGDRLVSDLWMSPDCTHHSKARGGLPVSKRVRGLAWVGVRWAATVRPRRIYLENVEEFENWGPLVKQNGQMVPCKRRAGRTFRSFVRELSRLGYDVEWRQIRACDHGAPTIRKRLFLIARCDGLPIAWPEATHAEPKAAAVKGLQPWRTAAECIDWSIPCPSIFGRKKPLAENTLRRIAKGIKRYVIDAPEPFIVPVTHQGNRKNHSLREPVKTITAAHRGELSLVVPSLTEHANGSTQRTFSIEEPLRTQCAQIKGGHFALQAAMLLKHYGGVVGHSVDQPAGAITTVDHHAIGAATLIQTGYGERNGQSPRVPHLDKPLGTVMAGGVKHAVTVANLSRHFGESTGSPMTEPVGTVMPGGQGKTSLTTSNLVKLRGTCRDGQRTDEPMPTVTAGGLHVAEVRAFLLKYYGADQDPQLLEPLHTITTRDRFGLVTVKGELYEIVDICMRMLAPRELYRAQGFPDSYIIEYGMDVCDKTGIPFAVKFTKTEQVRFCGNSVSPYAAAAIIAANNGIAVEDWWRVAA